MTQNRRKKTRKMRGHRKFGYGRIGKKRNSGDRGGTGLATGKWKHKFQSSIKQEKMGFPEHQKGFPAHGNPWQRGKKGFKRPQEVIRREHVEAINLYQIDSMLDKLVDENKAKKEGNVYKVNLKDLNYNKILAKGELTRKCEIIVENASERAIKKAESQGSTIKILEAEN